MTTPASNLRTARRVWRALVAAVVLAATVTVVPVSTPSASALASEWIEVWGISGGVVPNPKLWKFQQSTADPPAGLGTVDAADPALDDSGWGTKTLRWREFPGPNIANHFRKEFNLQDIGVFDVDAQIEGIRMTVQYDDTAVVYLNGTEVYRSIRGNMANDFAVDPKGTNFFFDEYVAYGGFENHYVHVPNWLGSNDCEFSGEDCVDSPYLNVPPGNLGTDPHEIPVSLLQDGVNTWAITTWNQSGGGSGDSSLNHTFQVLKNDVDPNTVFINEVVASNTNSYNPPGLGSPDWFELHNIAPTSVDLTGWTVSDSGTSWVFPAGASIPGNGYLVVAANDGDDGTTTPMQTNFKLSTDGDSLKLTNALGVVADDYGPLPPQFTDNGYGREFDIVGPGENITYLTGPLPRPEPQATPGLANLAEGNGYDPILRLFPDRLYNTGEAIEHQINAFDPDGDPLTYSLTPLLSGLALDTSTGLITGTAVGSGATATTLQVVDGDLDSTAQLVNWIYLEAPPPGSPPLVLNEYNAVAPDREFLSGSPLGNGGDWFEFVVVEDQLDLRGYTISMYDLKGPDDQLRLQSEVTFANRIEFAAVPAGTIIVISEDNPDDLSFDAINDWTINLQIDNTANGTFFETAAPGSLFNSTRTAQTVFIRDASGVLVTPLSGETEAWDEANGGVSGGEVMNLCVDPTPGVALDPLADYRDNGTTSTMGEPNQCSYPDPLNPPATITFDQDFTALRSGASLGAGTGDVNCDDTTNIGDALLILQYSVGLASDTGPCLLDQGGPGAEVAAVAGDVNGDLVANVGDSLLILQCEVGLSNLLCPA